MPNFLFLNLLMIIVCGCTDQQIENEERRQKTHFSTFEISYRGGWFGELSFYADSNKIYFSPTIYPKGIEDTVKYGILPDSVFQSINNFISKVQADTTIKSIDNHCDDCSVLAMQAETVSDTIQLIQSGKISKPIMDLINQLEVFIDSSKHMYFTSLMILETAIMISPSPPKIHN